MLECPKCGFNNELGRIFCHQCGNKLDLEKIKAPTKGARMRRRMKSGASRLIRIVIETAVAGVLLLGIVLMCLVPDLPPVRPTNAELVAADTKRMELEQMTYRTRPASLEVTPAEVNAFLHSLSFDKPKGTGIEVVPVQLRVDFGEGTVTASFLSEMRFGTLFGKRLFLSMTGAPVITPGGFDLKPTSGRIGSLPVPAKLLDQTDFVQKWFGRIFARLDTERQALDKLSSITVTSERAVLKYEPPAK